MGLVARHCSFCGQDRRSVDRLVVGHGGVAICGDCARLAAELVETPETPPSGDLLLAGIGALVTNDHRQEGLLGVIEGAALAVRHGRVTWVGRQRALPDRYRGLPTIECDGRMVTPGFVDAHRHFDSGGGADLADLTERVAAQLGNALEHGATTVEFRTWDARGPEEEVTMLAAMRAAADTLPADVVASMVVGSDSVPRGAGYRSMLESVLIPTASRIASYLDVVVGGPLDDEAARAVIRAGRRHGLAPRVHVDTSEALDLAFDCGAVSVDGMTGLGRAAEAVAASGTMMVSVPAAPWAAGSPDPAAEMWDAEAVVALGTGCRDGAVSTMPLAMAVAVHYGRLEPDQALWSATRGGALAIEEPEKGVVAPGAVADLVILDTETSADVVSEPGADTIYRVVKDGVAIGT